MLADNIYVLYAFLAAASLYLALLSFLMARLPGGRRLMALSNFCLALAFASLALNRSEILGFTHGAHPWITRSAFLGYATTLAILIGRYWLRALRQYRSEHKCLRRLNRVDGV